jgi:hypothetical protein
MLKLGKVMLGRQKEATTQARLDHLSQVNNRRSFDEKQKELFASLKDGWSHSLLILDIDNFKQVNDTLGHEAGDQFIIKFGNALKNCLRNSDFIARRRRVAYCSLYAGPRRNRPIAARQHGAGVTCARSCRGVAVCRNTVGRRQDNELARADAARLDSQAQRPNATRIRAAGRAPQPAARLPTRPDHQYRGLPQRYRACASFQTPPRLPRQAADRRYGP